MNCPICGRTAREHFCAEVAGPLTGVRVRLIGEDGNAFAIIAKVRNALLEAGHVDRALEFSEEAKAGDYDDLIAAAMKYVEVI